MHNMLRNITNKAVKQNIISGVKDKRRQEKLRLLESQYLIRKKKKESAFLKDTLDSLEKASNSGTINLLNREFRNEKNMTSSAS